MKKSLILAFTLPLLLVSCGKTIKIKSVSKSEFVQHYKAPETCRKPTKAIAKYTYKYDTTGMEAFGDTNEHESKKDKVLFTFNQDGTITPDHVTSLSYVENPSQLDLNSSGIIAAENQYDQYGGFLYYEFFINPLRIKYSTFLVDNDGSNSGTKLTTYDYTYNSDMWLTKFTYTITLKGYVGSEVATQNLKTTTTISYTF